MGIRLELARWMAGPIRKMLGIEGALLADVAVAEAVVERFVRAEVGNEYGVGAEQKRELVRCFKRNVQSIPSGTQWLAHVVLAEKILAIPKREQGAVIECGCWKGASTASLSLVCERAGRKLLVCDSFEGLPEEEVERPHAYPHIQVYGFYEKGMYAGRQAEVEENIRKFGAIGACEFRKGFFNESLKSLNEPIVFGFLDVDLLSSQEDCVKRIWPLLAGGGYIFTDDAGDTEVVKMWFDEAWWQRELGVRAPGYVGSGCGMPLNTRFSTLGYAEKVGDVAKSYGKIEWLVYPEGKGKSLETADGR